MKYEITKHNEVGTAEHGWLHAKHYFSFANYYNPSRMGFGKLRVINDDLVEPGRGFGTHPHRDMEIITIPLQGAVSHEDSHGNKGTIRKGEVQVMSAGTGILHSEFNHSKDERLGLYQIWIEPNKEGVEPRYGQEQFLFQNHRNQWTQLVSPISESEEQGLKIHQSAFINATVLEADHSLDYTLKHPGQGIYMLVSSGEVLFDDQTLVGRDAVAITDAESITVKATKASEIILIEVPLTH